MGKRERSAQLEKEQGGKKHRKNKAADGRKTVRERKTRRKGKSDGTAEKER